MMTDKLTEVEIRYNPFIPKTEIFIDEDEIKQSSKLYKYKGENINKWIFEIIELLIEEINDEEFKLTFVLLERPFNKIGFPIIDISTNLRSGKLESNINSWFCANHASSKYTIVICNINSRNAIIY